MAVFLSHKQLSISRKPDKVDRILVQLMRKTCNVFFTGNSEVPVKQIDVSLENVPENKL